MKIHERYLWIAAIILCGFVVQDQSKKNNKLAILLQTHQAGSEIQNSQIMDFSQEVLSIKSNEYQKGFEAGRSQAGIALVNGSPMLDYADGYHAALAQFTDNLISEDEDLIRQLELDIESMVKDE